MGIDAGNPDLHNGLARIKGKNPQRYTVTKSKKSMTRLNKLDTMKELDSARARSEKVAQGPKRKKCKRLWRIEEV